MSNITNQRQFDIAMDYFALREKGSFWLDLGEDYKSLEDFLARKGLIDGAELATLALFDRETYCYFGKECLDMLVKSIKKVQKNSEKRRADYQAIIESYRSKYKTFDSKHFKEVVMIYVEREYITKQPQQRPAMAHL
jgi:hypothetical protein